MKIASIRTSSEVAKARARRSARRRSSTLPPAIAARLSLAFFSGGARSGDRMGFWRSQFSVSLLDMGTPIGTFQTAQRKVRVRDPLEMVHEDDVNGGTAHRAENRQRAGRNLVGNHKPEA